MRAASRVALALALAPLSAGAQGLGDATAPPPDAAELDAIEQAWRARETARRFALRHTWRFFTEAGVSAFRYREHVTDDLTLRREDALAPFVAAGLRYGVTALVEVHARAEFAGPLPVRAMRNADFTAVAATPCDGQRDFSLVSVTGALATLDVGIRGRVFQALSPFYLGASLRVSAQPVWGGGAWSVRCIDASGAARPSNTGSADVSALVFDVGASLDTGYRFGANEAWEVGLRLLVHALGTNDAGLGGGSFFVGWSP